MLRFFTIFDKNLFKISIESDSDLTISSFSNKPILSLETDLSENKSFLILQNYLFSHFSMFIVYLSF